MDRVKIAALAKNMNTKEDLLDLLNVIKKALLEERGIVGDYHPFTMTNINYYCNPNNAVGRYKIFYIKKKSGGQRKITAPRNKTYKILLQCVNELFKSLYTPSDHVMGFTENRSVVTNASLHVGQNYIFNTDLRDFFPSISQARVWKRIQMEPFCFTQAIASLIAGMCAMREEVEDGDKKSYRYVLPQGAPTSPILTNIICDKLDRRLAGLAKRFGLKYSRYADDITFSSMHFVYQKNGDFRKELRRIIEDQNFTVNNDKTRLERKGGRQEVTGVIVSEKVNVSRQYSRNLRNILYIWEKYGYTVAVNKFCSNYQNKAGRRGTPQMIDVLYGRLQYMKMVKGVDDPVYSNLQSRFDKQFRACMSPERKNSFGLSYFQTQPLLEFEKQNKVLVEFEQSQEGHLYAYYFMGKRKVLVSLGKTLTKEETQDKNSLSFSSCRNKEGKYFYLIDRTEKKTTFIPNKVDLDNLNSMLDSILQEDHGTETQGHSI